MYFIICTGCVRLISQLSWSIYWIQKQMYRFDKTQGVSSPDEWKSVSRTECFPRIWSDTFLYYYPVQNPRTFLTAFHGIWFRLIFPIVHYVYKILIRQIIANTVIFCVEILMKVSNIHLHLLQVFYVNHNRLRRNLHKIIAVSLNNRSILINVISTIFIPISECSNFEPLIE
jgi:hypothetical protein